MRFFEILNMQHVMAFTFSALIFLFLFGAGLAYYHFRSGKKKKGREEDLEYFADGIAKGKEPFPLIIILIIVGTILWAFFYILIYGLSEVKI